MASKLTVSPSGWNYNPFKHHGNRNGAGKELKKRAVWWEQGWVPAVSAPIRCATPHTKKQRYPKQKVA
jgi:hypothetical protein